MTHSTSIVAVGPHPDDVELGCSGALLIAMERGATVVVVDLTAGERSSAGSAEARAAETEAASRILGIATRINLGLPDTELENSPVSRQELIRVLREVRPDIVLGPHAEDRHPDHRAAGRLVRDACFFAGVAGVGRGVPFRPSNLYFYLLHEPVAPSVVVDISGVWERKRAAIAAYRTQFEEAEVGMATALQGGAFMRAVEARAVLYGAMIGVDYGEAFATRGPVGLETLPCLNRSEGTSRSFAYRTY